MIELVLALAESDCEQLGAGWLAQPANAVSSLAFAAVGLWLLGRRKLMVGRRAVVVGAVAMAAVGLGSFAYHGPQPEWAGEAHDGSVAVLAVVVAGSTLWLGARPATRGGVVAAWRSALPWMVVALAAWRAGTTASSLCRPAALMQFHAVWHVLMAVGLGVLMAGWAAGGEEPPADPARSAAGVEAAGSSPTPHRGEW